MAISPKKPRSRQLTTQPKTDIPLTDAEIEHYKNLPTISENTPDFESDEEEERYWATKWSAAEFEAEDEPKFEGWDEEERYWDACLEYWRKKTEAQRIELAEIELAKAQDIKSGEVTIIPDATPQTSVAIARPRFEELDALKELKRRETVKRALFVGVWFLFTFVLALLAFGMQNLSEGGSVFVAAVQTPGVGRVAAFVGLGLMVMFGVVWIWREIRRRHRLEDIGMFMTYTAVAGVLVLLGSYFLDVQIGQLTTTFLWIISPLLFCAGIFVIREPKTEYVPPILSPAPQSVPSPHRENTIYGDARTAADWEIDQSLRDNSGGFDPMFKD